MTDRHGVMVLVKEGGTPVLGASSGLPLLAETPNAIEPFTVQGYDPGRLFYDGESFRGGTWTRRLSHLNQ